MATTQIFQPYEPSPFNTIPCLHEAYKSYQANNGADFVEKVFKPLVLKHHLDPQLGIGLLHRHFDLEAFEKLVELNNVSTAWAIKGDEHMGGKILPCSWLISSDGKLMPYEFFFSPGSNDSNSIGGGGSGNDSGSGGGVHVDSYKSLDPTESNVRAFLKEFIVTTKLHGFQNTLALRLFPGPDCAGGHEITHGRTNITLTRGQYNGVNKDNSIEAAWFFTPGCIGQQRGTQTCHKYTDENGTECHVQVYED